jgi:hypothetical protein
MFPAGPIDEDASHGLGGGGKEVGTTLPFKILIAGQAQPGFMHQGRGLQGMIGRFARHFARGKFAQFGVDEGEDLVGSLWIATLHLLENVSEFAHVGDKQTVLTRGYKLIQ